MGKENRNFPYKWNKEPKVNALLEAVIKKNWVGAENLMIRGMKLQDIDESTFKRALFEFAGDYETMEFLVKHGFNYFRFPHIYCVDDKNHIWGISARAYYLNNIRGVELLFRAGFSIFNSGQYYWLDNERSYPLWKWVFLMNFDKEMMDLILSYGCPIDYIRIFVDDADYNPQAWNYLKNNPHIELKGYILHPRWGEEIPLPEKPKIGIFTSRKKAEQLEKRYEKEMYDYENKKRVQKELIDSITAEEWELIKEIRESQKFAMDYFANGCRIK